MIRTHRVKQVSATRAQHWKACRKAATLIAEGIVQ